jgi:hypothetical protein
VPEYYGKPSPYTEGTAFLGTPTNHDEVRTWQRRTCCHSGCSGVSNVVQVVVVAFCSKQFGLRILGGSSSIQDVMHSYCIRERQ